MRLLLSQFKSPLVLILIFAAIISGIVGEWVDASIVIAIVLGSTILGFVQEYTASNAVAKLRSQVTVKSRLLRSDQLQMLPSEQVVPGDAVRLSAGSLIPADGLLLEATDFYVNQAVLTGETFPVEKMPGVVDEDAGLPTTHQLRLHGHERTERDGSGTCHADRNGNGIRPGGEAADGATPGDRVRARHTAPGLSADAGHAVLTLVVFAANVTFHKAVLDSLLFSVGLAVGLTPQMLPAIISIMLANGAQRMADAGVIVRRLASIENFGSMDVLCTDKTGTLTAGVVRLDRAGTRGGPASDDVFRLAYLNAHFETGLANPLDEAILQGAAELEVDSAWRKVGEIPYRLRAQTREYRRADRQRHRA